MASSRNGIRLYHDGSRAKPAYYLNPEIMESAYYLYQRTKDPRYLEMGKIFLDSLKTYCRTEAGYAELKSVITKEKSDRMETYFLAETLKYFYLLFAPDEDPGLRMVIFNTEAHPIQRDLVTVERPLECRRGSARHLLGLFAGRTGSPEAMEFMRHHFDVIQARSQLLLTLATLALTITGFSGPKIVQTNLFARYSMAVGIVFVLSAVVILLLGGLRIRWTTQFLGDEPGETLVRIIRYRNHKTKLYFVELGLLVIGTDGICGQRRDVSALRPIAAAVDRSHS